MEQKSLNALFARLKENRVFAGVIEEERKALLLRIAAYSNQDSFRLLPISVLDFSRRTQGCLSCERIQTIGELLSKTRDELIRLPNIGRHVIKDIEEVLLRHGLHLKR